MSPTHFFYKATLPEVAAFIRGIEERERNEWERVRTHVFKVAQILGGGDIKPTDIMRLPWDEEKKPVTIDQDNLNRVRKLAKKLENE